MVRLVEPDTTQLTYVSTLPFDSYPPYLFIVSLYIYYLNIYCN